MGLTCNHKSPHQGAAQKSQAEGNPMTEVIRYWKGYAASFGDGGQGREPMNERSPRSQERQDLDSLLVPPEGTSPVCTVTLAQ